MDPMEQLYSQRITRRLARELAPDQRRTLLALIQRLVHEAAAEGAGAGIWYILREHEEVIRDLGVAEEVTYA